MHGAIERFTLDTNLLVYTVERNAGVRRQLALEIVDRSVDADCRLTLQSLSEFYSAATRKGMVSPERAAELIDKWLQLFQTVPGSASSIRIALIEAVAGRTSYWDALLIATAAEAGCTVILTEDLQHGARIAGVEIHNPFDPAGGLTERVQRLLGL